MRDLQEAPFLDFFDPEMQADPWAVHARLRAETSVARTPLGISVLRREPAHRLLGDARLASAIPYLVGMQVTDDGPLREMLGATVIAMDGSDHTRLRRLVSRTFTPRNANRHRPVMRQLVEELVRTFAESGRCEFVTEFGDHYPVRVICEVLGVPGEDHHLFARWGEALTYVLSLELASHFDEVERAASELSDYVDDLIEQRRREPREDLVTSLIEASEDGDRLSSMELRAMIGGLLFAGYDTTRNQLGHAMVVFAQHPDQWALLADDPTLAPAAVDEVMRYSGAVSGIPRIATEALEIDGWAVPAGTAVFLSVASANRDETVYEEPARFDITAARTPHLTFGGGPHYCLGANLARAEMEEALRILPGRLPRVRLDGEPTWRQGTGISGPSRLPLVFERPEGP